MLLYNIKNKNQSNSTNVIHAPSLADYERAYQLKPDNTRWNKTYSERAVILRQKEEMRIDREYRRDNVVGNNQEE